MNWKKMCGISTRRRRSLFPKMDYMKLAGISKKDLGLPTYRLRTRRRKSIRRMINDV